MSPRVFIVALALACIACPAPGQPGAQPVSTNAAGGDIQLPKNLPPRLREKMAKMPPAERQKFLERWQQLRKLSPEARKLLNKNYQSFSKMPPEQREQLKQRLQQWQGMSPEEKKKLQENFQRWKQLSPQEREDLRKRHTRPPPANGRAPSGGPRGPAVKALPAAAKAE
ncbi:MAG: DUF3106 domain-containing protein [Verrucomicrobia bacterium]|nr:DUF3106 domain-containing protein [Verrucomicrobiota bacterium]